jgi:diadenosine tetraphosphatase ApaH/serine/threonine PP2A family protein phosphatase
MRYLVLADVHGNIDALEACLADAGARGYDRVLVLGDVVGYGGDPNGVVTRIRALEPAAIVRGNHDKAACGIDRAEGFNAVARRAARWTFSALTPEHREWLAALPAGPILVDACIEVCHGSPLDEDGYIFDELDALRALQISRRPLCLFGHTHYPVTYELSGTEIEASIARPDGPFRLRAGSKYLVNPGAVGQPRDGDPRAAYAIVEDESDQASIEFCRVDYPIQTAQQRIVEAGLPDVLAHRLALGR